MSRVIYLAWGRPHRPRANLIQTLHTVEALTLLGMPTRLYLPNLPRNFDVDAFFARMGVRHRIDLHGALSLHRRWRGWPFALLHRGELQAADVVYTRVPEISLALARTGIAHWLEIHDTETLQKRGHLERITTACKAKKILGLVAISSAGRDALVAAGAPEARVHVLASGVDVEAFGRVPTLRIEQLAEPRAIYVGRISTDRGLSILQQIAASGCPVRLIGPHDHTADTGTPHLETLPAVAHADVPECYFDAEIALMPYQEDLRHAASISPIKLFEAMAAGRLVIASDLRPIREIVSDSVNGLLVPPDDPSAWLEAIAWARSHPAKALAIAEAGRRHASRFSWLARAERLLAITGIRP